MENITFEDIARFILVMGVLTLFAFGNVARKTTPFTRRKSAKKPRPIQPEFLQPLQDHFLYYQNLSAQNKNKFEMRVQAFIDSNEFIPRSYTHVTPEMKALISGSAVQLTFGFKHLNFEHFHKILIYQDDYYSRITRKYHAGEVNIRGLIVLSWRNFVKGYKDHSDGRNLGLHEMAHALRLENAIQNGEYDFIDPKYLEKFNFLAEGEMKRIRRGQSLFFRHYASMNLHEFFAVAIENFFERPHKFLEYNPDLYQCMAVMLKQDPIKLFPEMKPERYDKLT